jgi:WD40 repeat protein
MNKITKAANQQLRHRAYALMATLAVTLWIAPMARGLEEQSRPRAFSQSIEGTITSLAFSPDGRTLAAGYSLGPSTTGGVVLWDVASGERGVEESLPVTEGFVTKMAFSPCGNILAAGYAHTFDPLRGGVVLWDLAERKRVTQVPLLVKEGPVESMAFSPDGKALAAEYGLGADGVVLWDVAGRKRVIHALLPHAPQPVKQRRVASVAFSPDSKTLAVAYVRAAGVLHWNEAARELDVSIMLWDVAERKLVSEEFWPVTYGLITTLAFSPDRKILAAGYSYERGAHLGGGVLLWDVAGRTGGS